MNQMLTHLWASLTMALLMLTGTTMYAGGAPKSLAEGEEVTITFMAEGSGSVTAKYFNFSTYKDVFIQSGDKVPNNVYLTFQALPNEGNQLVKWIVNGEDRSPDPETPLSLIEHSGDGSLDVIAVFDSGAPVTAYKCSFSAGTGGSISGQYTLDGASTSFSSGDMVPVNAFVELKAIANEGYEIDEWRENGEVQEYFHGSATYGFISDVTRDVHVTFKPKSTESQTYNVKLVVVGYGKATLSGAQYYDEVPEGTVITVSAIPDEGRRIDYIKANDIDITEQARVEIHENTVIAVAFGWQTFHVQIETEGEGTIQVKPTWVDLNEVFYDEVLTLEPEGADESWYLSSMTANGKDILASRTVQVREDMTIRAVFSQQNSGNSEIQGYKMLYRTGFESCSPSALNGDIVNIDGRRWRIKHGAVISRTSRSVLKGEQALALEAYGNTFDSSVDSAQFELIDPFTRDEGLPDNIAFYIGMVGQDGNLGDAGWHVAFSYDMGATWGHQLLPSPAMGGGLIQMKFPDYNDQVEKMLIKIYYAGSPTQGGGKLWIDDLQLYTNNNEEGQLATQLWFSNLSQGFRTALRELPIKVEYNGMHGFTDPNNPIEIDGFDTYAQVYLDGEKYTELYRITLSETGEPDFILKELNPGKHTLRIVLCKLDGTPWGPEPEEVSLDFEVINGEPTEAQGIEALRLGEEGRFYRLTPKSSAEEDRIYLNVQSIYHGQRYLSDTTGAIMIEDSQYHTPVERGDEVHPKQLILKEAVGELIRQNGILQLRIDRPILLDSLSNQTTLQQITFSHSSLQSVVDTLPHLESRVVVLMNVTFAKEDQAKGFQVGDIRYLGDSAGTRLGVYNIMDVLFKRSLPTAVTPSYPINLIALVTRNYKTQELMLAPIYWEKATGVETLAVDQDEAYDAHTLPNGDIWVKAPAACSVEIFSMSGELRYQATFSEDAIIPAGLATGAYILLLQDEQQRQAYTLLVP